MIATRTDPAVLEAIAILRRANMDDDKIRAALRISSRATWFRRLQELREWQARLEQLAADSESR